MLPVDVPPADPGRRRRLPGADERAARSSWRARPPAGSVATPYAYAWGDPPVVLRLRRRPRRPASSWAPALIQINGVQWYVDTTDPDATVWTTVDRPVYVRCACRPRVDSALGHRS